MSCPTCHQVISRRQLDAYLISRLLDERGDEPIWEHVKMTPDTSGELLDIQQALRDAAALMLQDDADTEALREQIDALKKRRSEMQLSGPSRTLWRLTSESVRAAWSAAHDEGDRRQVLSNQVDRIVICRGKVGRVMDPGRVRIHWRPIPEGIPLPDGSRIVVGEEISGEDLLKPIYKAIGPLLVNVNGVYYHSSQRDNGSTTQPQSKNDIGT